MDKRLCILGMALLMVLVLTFFAGCGGPPAKKPDPPSRMTGTAKYDGYCGDPQYGNEPSSQKVGVEISGNMTGQTRVVEVTFKLVWTEDPDDAHAPQDTFTMTVGNESVSGNANVLTITLKDGSFSTSQLEEGTVFDGQGLGNSFSADISISECGYDPLGPIGFIIYPDRGNSFTLEVNYVFYGYEAGAEE